MTISLSFVTYFDGSISDMCLFLTACSQLFLIHRSEEVVAVASMNYDPIVSRVAEVLGSGKTIKKRDVE